MRPKQCPNCNELANIDDKFCPKCRLILSYDIYLETVQKQENENLYIKEMQKQIDEIYAKIKANDLKNK
jgi:predicted amidophosphoribosyltransferase